MTMHPTPSSEMGRSLTASELVERTVVCVRREDRPIAATLWVEKVTKLSVTFLAGATVPHIVFMTFRLADDTLIDDSGKKMFVYEYLGKV